MATISANPTTYEDGVTRPATADEKSAIAQAKALDDAQVAEEAAKAQAAASAVTKLEAIGLTSQEIAALKG